MKGKLAYESMRTIKPKESEKTVKIKKLLKYHKRFKNK